VGTTCIIDHGTSDANLPKMGHLGGRMGTNTLFKGKSKSLLTLSLGGLVGSKGDLGREGKTQNHRRREKREEEFLRKKGEKKKKRGQGGEKSKNMMEW